MSPNLTFHPPVATIADVRQEIAFRFKLDFPYNATFRTQVKLSNSSSVVRWRNPPPIIHEFGGTETPVCKCGGYMAV